MRFASHGLLDRRLRASPTISQTSAVKGSRLWANTATATVVRLAANLTAHLAAHLATHLVACRPRGQVLLMPCHVIACMLRVRQRATRRRTDSVRPVRPLVYPPLTFPL